MYLVADFDREYHHDLTADVLAGAGWTWFEPRLVGLTEWAAWPRWRRNRPRAPLAGEAAERYFATI